MGDKLLHIDTDGSIEPSGVEVAVDLREPNCRHSSACECEIDWNVGRDRQCFKSCIKSSGHV